MFLEHFEETQKTRRRLSSSCMQLKPYYGEVRPRNRFLINQEVSFNSSRPCLRAWRLLSMLVNVLVAVNRKATD